MGVGVVVGCCGDEEGRSAMAGSLVAIGEENEGGLFGLLEPSSWLARRREKKSEPSGGKAWPPVGEEKK